VLVSWDAVEAEERYIAAPAGGPAAEESFDRDWAWETLRQALGRLRREQEGRGNAAAFSRLEPYLTGEPPVGFYEQLSAAAGRTEAALRVEMHRLRQRWVSCSGISGGHRRPSRGRGGRNPPSARPAGGVRRRLRSATTALVAACGY